MNEHEVEKLLVDTGALLEGHFLLTSGRHSARYIEKFRLLEQPRITSQLCAELARRFVDRNIQCVVGPITGGIILAFEVGRQLGCRAVYAERAEGGQGFSLRRGFRLAPGERVLVVEDIVTTGGSVRQVLDTVRAAGGEVVGVGLLVDRSGGQADFDVPVVEALLNLNIESYAPDAVPAELEQKYGSAIKPGSSVADKLAGPSGA
ncbi:MAG: orotate phosphoribosyltransferase [Abitibacteriaceae bacterium]|nr:orotate phosphoribosyltransferase [Abditibacteriaceae bacterium]